MNVLRTQNSVAPTCFGFGPATPVLHIDVCTGQNLMFQRTAIACSGGNYLGDLPVSVNLEWEGLSSAYLVYGEIQPTLVSTDIQLIASHQIRSYF